jgi:pimeloyl-ACP methyl ester carboxylesterase
MPYVSANNIRIEYETFGNNSAQPLILIIGLGCQMLCWDEELCEQLSEKGLYVIRFDNRDVGLSTKLEDAGIPNIMETIGAILQRKEIKAPYTLDDMADDTVGLMDALGIQKAHICGISMGAAIAQTVAIRHPRRVSTLISIYGGTGNPNLPQPKPEALDFFISPAPEEREAFIEYFVKGWKMAAGTGSSFDEKWHRKMAARSYDRAFYPQGQVRQLVAILAHGNRKRALVSVAAPTLVIHGTVDPIMPLEGGKDTAEAIPGADLLIIDGLGHGLPHGEAWPQIVDAIAMHIKKASA